MSRRVTVAARKTLYHAVSSSVSLSLSLSPSLAPLLHHTLSYHLVSTHPLSSHHSRSALGCFKHNVSVIKKVCRDDDVLCGLYIDVRCGS